MPSLPGPFRAAVGLAATVADNVKQLPERALELPMLLAGTALQLSLRAQQHYAVYAARGEQILTGAEPEEDVAGWATFDPPPGGDHDEDHDDDEPAAGKPITGPRNGSPSRFDAVDD